MKRVKIPLAPGVPVKVSNAASRKHSKGWYVSGTENSITYRSAYNNGLYTVPSTNVKVDKDLAKRAKARAQNISE
jgi:hypothetical protein